MDIIKRQDKKEVYTVIERSKNIHALVKVLNVYDTDEEAMKALIDRIQGNISEEELLQDYIQKEREERNKNLK